MIDFLSHLTNVQPYATPIFLVYVTIAVLPVMIGLYFGKRFRIYETIFSFVLLLLMFDGNKITQGIALICFIIWQMIIMSSYANYRKNNNSMTVFIIAIIGSILPLVLVKISPLIKNGHNPLQIVGFIGVSYITFKTVQIIMELRDGAMKEFKWNYILHFLLFYPTLSSGPIDRYRRFMKDYLKPPEKLAYLELVGEAFNKFLIGCLYNFIIAYLVATRLMPFITEQATGFGFFHWTTVAYMFAYSADLFFNFAGYSLFAIGLSNLMGIRTPANFNKPFIALNIKDFWNRWHMSLSFWFRDFIYMRIVFYLMKNKVFKSKIVLANVGYFSLFTIMGFWHGLTWYYITYGLYQATLIITNDWWIRYRTKHFPDFKGNILSKSVSWLITFTAVCFGFLIFSGYLDRFI